MSSWCCWGSLPRRRPLRAGPPGSPWRRPCSGGTLGARRRLVAADEPSRQRARRLATLEDDGPADDGHGVAGRVLNQPAALRREVEDHLWRGEREAVEIDQITIGLHAGSEHAAIAHPVQLRGVPGLAPHEVLDREPGPALPAASPVREQERGRAGIADDAAVCAAVREPDHRAGMQEHLADRLEVEAGVVEEREVEQLVAVALEQEVVGYLLRRDAAAAGDRRDAGFRRRLVVGRVAEGKELVEGRRQEREDRV